MAFLRAAIFTLVLAAFDAPAVWAGEFQPGPFEITGEEVGDVNLIFLKGGRGRYRVLDNLIPFTWKSEGNKLRLTFDDSDYQKTFGDGVATLKGSDSFTINGEKFIRNKDLKVSEYRYAEPGCSGSLVLLDFGGSYQLDIDTTSDNGSTCGLVLECDAQGSAIVCRDPENGEPDAKLTLISRGADLIAESTLNYSDYCGMNGRFEGKYKR